MDKQNEIVIKSSSKLDKAIKIISYISSIAFIVCALFSKITVGFAVFGVGLITTIILKVIKSKKECSK